MRVLFCLVLTLGFVARAADPEPVVSQSQDVARRFSAIDARLDQIEQRLDSISTKLAQAPRAAEEPLYKRWYVWAGAATGVSIAVTVAVVLANGKSASPPTAQQVCAGPCAATITRF